MEINHTGPNLSWIICSQTEKGIINKAIIYSLDQKSEPQRANRSADNFNQHVVQILQKIDYLEFRAMPISDNALEYLAEVLCEYSIDSNNHSDALTASYLADQLYEEWDKIDQPKTIEMAIESFKIPDNLQDLIY